MRLLQKLDVPRRRDGVQSCGSASDRGAFVIVVYLAITIGGYLVGLFGALFRHAKAILVSRELTRGRIPVVRPFLRLSPHQPRRLPLASFDVAAGLPIHSMAARGDDAAAAAPAPGSPAAAGPD